jgi:GT2 family glycosyltransferase
VNGIRCVVVNFNAGPMLTRCVADLLEQDPSDVVVVDNASDDDSLSRLETDLSHPGRVRIIRNDANRGFASACNRAAGDADSEYLAFINPDCRVPSGSLAALRQALAGRADTALAGAWVVDPDGSEQRGTRRRLPTPWRALMTFSGLERLAGRWPALGGVNWPRAPALNVTAVEAVNGACFLVRTRDFREIGGFDTGYFLHCEDLDLFKRLADRGRGLCLVPEARVVHEQGVSSQRVPVRVAWHKHRGMMRYLFAHHARGRDRLWLVPGLIGLWLHFLMVLPLAAVNAARSR